MMKYLLPLTILFGAVGSVGAATLGKITVRPPAPWKPVRAKGSGRPRSDGQIVTWSAPGGKSLHLNYWPGGPPEPGGAMVAAEKINVVVAGEKMQMIRTAQFHGQYTEVWVVFFQRGPAWYRLYARGVTRQEFEAVLRSITWKS